MKITIYTINDCKFSQAEKQYLTSKNMQFEEKNLETNREYLTEMLNISNNFAGTPVTKIEKDDGTSVVLKGFTQSEFDTALGLSTDSAVAPSGSMDTGTTAAVAQTTATQPPVTPSMDMSSSVAAASTEPTAPSMNTVTPPVEPPKQDMSMGMPSTTSTDVSAAPSSMPMDTASDPVAANPTSVTPAPMGNPLTDTTPTTPTMNDVMAAPQGEAIPSTPAPTDSNMTTPSMGMSDMNTAQPSMGGMSTTPDMSMGQTPNPMSPPAEQSAAPANDPLSSVLNDLQSKGST